MRKIEKHFNELMLIALVAFVPLTMTSCSEDECTENYRVSVVQERQAVSTVDLGGMTGDVTLSPSDATNGEVQTTGDVNLNGHELKVVNIKLTINGNLNGGGQVRTQGSNAVICVLGNIQNNPNTQGVNFECESLSTPVLVAPDTIQAQCGLSVGDIVEIDGVKYRIQY